MIQKVISCLESILEPGEFGNNVVKFNVYSSHLVREVGGSYSVIAGGFTIISETSNFVKPDSDGLLSTPLNLA